MHFSKHLQSSWNKYGEDNFEFVLLDLVEADDLTSKEVFWVNILGVLDPKIGYNTILPDTKRRVREISDKTRLRMSISKRGKSQKIETILARVKLFEKKVYCVDKIGNTIYYDSIKDAANNLNIARTAISKCLSDNYPNNKTAGGYSWNFVEA